MRLLRLTALLCTLVLLAACGHKGPVRPLKAKRPGPATALQLRQQGKAMLLGWQLPKQNIDGSVIETAPTLDIYRMTYDPQNDCPECFDRSTLLFSIEPDLATPARKVADRYQLLDHQVEPGIGYQYKLIARSDTGEAGSPVILRQSFVSPPPAVKKVQVISHDRSIALTWRAADMIDGDSLLGYQIYRKTDDGQLSAAPLNSQPLQTTSFEDFNLENGRRYSYSIRVLVQRGEKTLEGVVSAELSGIPKAGL